MNGLNRSQQLSRKPKSVEVEEYAEGLKTELRYQIRCEWLHVRFIATIPLENVREFKRRFARQVQRNATEHGVLSTARRLAKRFQGDVRDWI